MGLSGTAAYRDFYGLLTNNISDNFERECLEMFSYLYANVFQSERLKDYDKAGFDLFVTDSRTAKPVIFIQCKSSQSSIKNSHIDTCLASIDNFLRSEYAGNIYCLIVNKPLHNDQRKVLDDKLKSLLKKHKVKKVLLLDINDLLRYVESKIKGLLLGQAKRKAISLFKDYKSILDQKFYYPNAPFKLEKHLGSNPIKYITERVKPLKAKSFEERGKFQFLISEFGFGKTSTMFEIFNYYAKSRGFLPIYIPISSLPSNTFVGESNVSKRILEILNPDIDYEKPFGKFIRATFQNILKNNSKIILLFDGMDEHYHFRNYNNLRSFFSSIVNFKAVSIFSMRKEFWDDRREDINSAIGNNRSIQDKILLTEWTDDNIVEFLEIHTNQLPTRNKLQISRLNNLQKAIAEGQYLSMYGDIPKRPLFLKMLMQDVQLSTSPKSHSLSSMYYNYISNKIKRDITGSFRTIVVDRNVLQHQSMQAFTERIFQLLEATVADMVFLKNNELVCLNEIDQYKLQQTIALFNFDDILDVLLHSVIVYSNISEKSKTTLKFAHFSFLEYFAAHYIINKAIRNDLTPEWYEISFPSSLQKFMYLILAEKIDVSEVNKIEISTKFKQWHSF